MSQTLNTKKMVHDNPEVQLEDNTLQIVVPNPYSQTDLENRGYADAQLSKGDPEVYIQNVNVIRYRIQADALNSDQRKREKKPEIQELEAANSALRLKNEADKKQINATNCKRDKAKEEYNRLCELKASHPEKMVRWIQGMIGSVFLFALSCFIFVYYFQLTYTAFAQDMAKTILEYRASGETITLPAIFNSNAWSLAVNDGVFAILFCSLCPSIVFILGALIHFFSEKKRFAIVVFLIVLNFILDFILAASTVHTIYSLKFDLGLGGIDVPWDNRMLLRQIDFYAIVILNFLAYILFAMCLKLCTNSFGIGGNAKISYLAGQIKVQGKTIDKLEKNILARSKKVSLNLREINRIAKAGNAVRINKICFDQPITQYTLGWTRFFATISDVKQAKKINALRVKILNRVTLNKLQLLILTLLLAGVCFNHAIARDASGSISCKPTYYNIEVIIDLSNRLLKTGQCERDISLINQVVDRFGENVQKNLFRFSKDKLQIRVAPQAGTSYNAASFEERLAIDMNLQTRQEPARLMFARQSKELKQAIIKLYAIAKTSPMNGADIYTALQNCNNDELIMGDPGMQAEIWQNRLIIITDGYLEFNRPVLKNRPAKTFFCRTELDKARAAGKNYEEIITLNHLGITPLEKDLKTLKVGIVEVTPNETTHSPYEFGIIQKLWFDFFKKMNADVNVQPGFSSEIQSKRWLNNFLN